MREETETTAEISWREATQKPPHATQKRCKKAKQKIQNMTGEEVQRRSQTMAGIADQIRRQQSSCRQAAHRRDAKQETWNFPNHSEAVATSKTKQCHRTRIAEQTERAESEGRIQIVGSHFERTPGVTVRTHRTKQTTTEVTIDARGPVRLNEEQPHA